MKHLKPKREAQLSSWIATLEEIANEFPGSSINIDTAIRSFKSQLKELEKK